MENNPDDEISSKKTTNNICEDKEDLNIEKDFNNNFSSIKNTSNKKKKIIISKPAMIMPPLRTQALIPPQRRRFSSPLKKFFISDSDINIFSKLIDNIHENLEISRKKNLSVVYPNKRMYIRTSSKDKNDTKIKTNINSIDTNNEENTTDINNKGNNSKHKINNLETLESEKSLINLEEHWKYEVIILDYNIIDFTSKYNKIFIKLNVIIYLNIFYFSDQ